MKSASIWAIALAATVSAACDNGNINDNTAGADRTGAATADQAPGTARPAGTAGSEQAATDPGRAATMARANDADNDRAFVEKIGQANVAEAKLGQLAAERAANAQVKQFAGRMVNDHQKANTELKQIASKMAVQLPADLDAKHQELYDRLSKLKGAEFDREYMKAMVDGHQEVLSELERHADDSAGRSVGTSGDASEAHASVTGYAKKMVPDVRQHLEQAKQINGKL
jgi:putative membrane protein